MSPDSRCLRADLHEVTWTRVQAKGDRAESGEVEEVLDEAIESFGFGAHRRTGPCDILRSYDSVGEGLSVASWVMLWFPLQMATMEVWQAILRRRRMRVIERVRVRVIPADPAPEP